MQTVNRVQRENTCLARRPPLALIVVQVDIQQEKVPIHHRRVKGAQQASICLAWGPHLAHRVQRELICLQRVLLFVHHVRQESTL